MSELGEEPQNNDNVVFLVQTDDGLHSIALTPSQYSELNTSTDLYILENESPETVDTIQLVGEESKEDEPPKKHVRLSELKVKKRGFQRLSDKLSENSNYTVSPSKRKINNFQFKPAENVKQYIVTNEDISSLKLDNPHIQSINEQQFILEVPVVDQTPNINIINVPDVQLNPNKNFRKNLSAYESFKNPIKIGLKPDTISKKNVHTNGNLNSDENTVLAMNNERDTVVYDPQQKKNIIYRIVHPEDLNLYSVDEIKKKTANIPKPKTKPVETKDLQPASVTRSGRKVRPPKHMSADYEKSDSLNSNTDFLNFDLDMMSEGNEKFIKKKIACPSCLKAYTKQRNLAKHLLNVPNHATTDKVRKILEDYQSELKESRSIQTQTDPEIINIPASLPKIINPVETLPSQIQPEKKPPSNPTVKRRDERSLFANLIRMLEHAPEENRVFVFIRQLTTLVIKLQRLLPCLMHKEPTSTACTVNEALSKLLNLDPGKYKFNMNAISCARMPLGKCAHSPAAQNRNVPNQTLNSQWVSDSTNKLCNPMVVPENNNQVIPLPKWDSNNIWVNNENASILKASPKTSDYHIANPVTWDNTNSAWMQKANQSCEMEKTSEWLQNNAEMIINTANLKDSMNEVKAWTSNLKEPLLNNANQQSWQDQSMDNLNGNEMASGLDKNNMQFSCNSELIFEMKNQIPSKMKELKQDVPQKVMHSNQVEHFNFNSNEFEMQIDASNITFTREDFETLKLTAETLPAFQKLDEESKLPLPVDNFNIISEDDKIHLSQNSDGLLEPQAFPITTSDALELSLGNSCAISTNVAPCTTATLSNEKVCKPTPLSEAELILPLSDSDSLARTESLLSQSSLEENRSVLHLLDPLGSDCLSFSDAELRPSSQMPLDLPLDLFPFQHQ